MVTDLDYSPKHVRNIVTTFSLVWTLIYPRVCLFCTLGGLPVLNSADLSKERCGRRESIQKSFLTFWDMARLILPWTFMTKRMRKTLPNHSRLHSMSSYQMLSSHQKQLRNLSTIEGLVGAAGIEPATLRLEI
jgi:hypothetical protein